MAKPIVFIAIIPYGLPLFQDISVRERFVYIFTLDNPSRNVIYYTCDSFRTHENYLHNNEFFGSKEIFMTEKPKITELTKREREIMEVIYRYGRATATDVVDCLPGKPNNATIRTMLGVLEEKGFVQHVRVKGRFVYYPTIPMHQAGRTALNQVLEMFFKGSEASAVISILKKSDADLSDDDRNMILELISKSRKEGR
jgi:predicted transcriptional regulator